MTQDEFDTFLEDLDVKSTPVPTAEEAKVSFNVLNETQINVSLGDAGEAIKLTRSSSPRKPRGPGKGKGDAAEGAAPS